MLQSDDLRQVAFDKFIRRLKEKEEDAERERNKRRERSPADSKYSHRDRERGDKVGHNSHRSSVRHGRPSRTPEPDAYEADRKKAQADREKQYRRFNTAVSPPHRSDRGDRVERDVEKRQSRREGSISHYDRDRRDREEERERLYRTRGDPRGSRDELDYGADRPSGRRRRADSDVESVGSRRDSKVRPN